MYYKYYNILKSFVEGNILLQCTTENVHYIFVVRRARIHNMFINNMYVLFYYTVYYYNLRNIRLVINVVEKLSLLLSVCAIFKSILISVLLSRGRRGQER